MAAIFETSAAAVPSDPVWRLSVAQYHSMIEAGILNEDDPVELLEGLLIVKMPKNPALSAATRLIRRLLERAIPAGWYVDTQEPVTTAESEPEPDVMIVRGDAGQYLSRHPHPEDLALVVEIAGATLKRDREIKMRIYAAGGIPVYWLVNLGEKQIEVYTEPVKSADRSEYAHQQIYTLRDEIPVLIEGNEIARLMVRDILP